MSKKDVFFRKMKKLGLALTYGCEPVYRVFPGWKTSISDIRSYEHLPQELRSILDYVRSNADMIPRIISVGRDRDQTIILP